MRAAEVMTSPVISVPPGLPVQEAALVLLRNRIAAAPVVDDGRLVGIVSELDLLWAQTLTDPRAHLFPVAPRPDRLSRTVADVMTREVLAMGPDADSADLVEHMRREKVRSIPIVDGDRLVGIVARRDLLRSLTRPDAELLVELRIRLRESLPDGDAWGLDVVGGVARLWPLTMPAPDPALAQLVAGEVPGVLAAVFVAGPGSRPDDGAAAT